MMQKNVHKIIKFDVHFFMKRITIQFYKNMIKLCWKNKE